MHETASKRSKTILVVGLVIGAIAGIVGGALALAGIAAGTAAMIPFIIAGISIFAGIIFSIASLPETDQMYEARLTVEYAKKALTSDDKEKAEVLSYINNILATTENIGDKEFYLYEERSNLLRLAVQTFLVENKKEIISCLNSNDSNVKSSAINLLSKAISRKDLSKETEEIIKFFNKDDTTNFVKNCLNCSDNEVIINTFYLLGKMIESEDSSMKDVGISALTENKEGIYGCLINGSKDVKNSAIALLNKVKIEDLNENKEIIQGLLNDKKLTDIQGDELLIIKIMLYSKDSNVSKAGINVLTNTINKSKDTAKKLFDGDILNIGIVKKMINNESTRNEMLGLLWLMSKDEDLKKVVNKLVGSDITDKLTKLNPQSTTEEKDKIIEEIKGLKLGIPEKLNAGDIVYKKDHDFGKNLTVLEQSEKNIESAEKFKNFFKDQETVNELKDRFSKNDGLRYENGKIQGCFLQDDKNDFDKKTNKIDSKKIANESIKDLNRDLFSIKTNSSKYIIKNQDKVGTELEKLLKNEPTKDAFTKIIKDKMKVDINTLCSFPGQSVQGNVSALLLKSELFAENTSSTYSVSINTDGTVDLTVHDVLRVECQVGLGRSTLPVAIEQKMVFRLNKQKEGEYVPITPLEAQVNVYDVDVLVEDKEDEDVGYREPIAFRIREEVTSIDWKNDKIKK